ncbi:protein of unknown function (plasmid) [Rhodovastum atsumiense]|nr:protein of unknown function [Rhodovastum atsumiense]
MAGRAKDRAPLRLRGISVLPVGAAAWAQAAIVNTVNIGAGGHHPGRRLPFLDVCVLTANL